MTPSITQAQIFRALWNFLTAALPDGVQIIQAQVNRVPEPKVPNWALMTLLRRNRLATNIDTPLDALFVGSIAGDILTITDVAFGSLGAGQEVFGTGIAPGTLVTGTVGGTGGVGTYRIDPAQTVVSGTIAAGQIAALQETQITIQVDVFGPDSADNAQVITTLMGDDYASRFFADTSQGGGVGGLVSPLYASDPVQIPFTNEQMQYEDRWATEIVLQVNPSVAIPQQFAGVLDVGILDVDVTYPPT